jgi:CD109 antigen
LRGLKNVAITAPDQITKYIFSGVSVNEIYGLGLPDIKPELRVFIPFFIQFNLPHHVKRGEILEQSIAVFNYLPESQDVALSVDRNDADFVVFEPELDQWTVESNAYVQSFKTQSNKPKGLRIVIKPKRLGLISLKVTALGSIARDAVEKPLRVIPEGIPKSITDSVLLMKKEASSTIEKSLVCNLPPSAVSDTTSAFATVAGDLMGDALNNLENLIQMSYGCGEQNMLNLVPNIVALIYLEATGKISESLRQKAIAYAEDGYQRQLTYRHYDGSFSAFGNSDPYGSSWLTAYCVKTFLLARPYITIDKTVISDALNFIISKQNKDGSFREDGMVIHKDMQGGSGSGIGMTAYISSVLSENLAEFPQYTNARDRALDYIVTILDMENVYDLAICAYALDLGDHSGFTSVYDQLINKGINTGDTLYWEKAGAAIEDQNCWWWNSQPRSSAIEITSYALQVILNKDMAKAVMISKYLVSKKNSFGGYGSSQDTVVGLKALAAFSIKFNAQMGTIKIHIQPDFGTSINTEINEKNLLAIQVFDLDNYARRLDVSSGEGSIGSAIVSLTCKFYEIETETTPRFEIIQNFPRACKTSLRSEICIRYIARGEDVDSNMVLVTMNLPSGYKYVNNPFTQPIRVRLNSIFSF